MTIDGRFQSRDTYYGAEADRRHKAFYRDPIIDPADHGRAAVANGKRGRWGRYHNSADLVWAMNLEGQLVALTRNQANVYGEAKRLACTGIRVTMRALAIELGVAASTVYRALVRLEALGFLAYQSNRGRLGGVVFLLREINDGLDWKRQEARATLRRWYKAAEARISRLRGNVASLHPGRETELYEHRYVTSRNVAQHFPAWTPEDFREAGLM